MCKFKFYQNLLKVLCNSDNSTNDWLWWIIKTSDLIPATYFVACCVQTLAQIVMGCVSSGLWVWVKACKPVGHSEVWNSPNGLSIKKKSKQTSLGLKNSRKTVKTSGKFCICYKNNNKHNHIFQCLCCFSALNYLFFHWVEFRFFSLG